MTAGTALPVDDERSARAFLCAAVEPSNTGIGLLVAEHGAQVVARDIAQAVPAAVRHRAARVSGSVSASGPVRFLIPGDREWPEQLADLGDEAPYGLWARGAGDLRALTSRSVAVVGARAASDYGVRVASTLAGELADDGWCIVSGGAYGIDAAAHRGALAVDGCTVVVLASGVDVAYPSAHDSLFDRCCTSGLVVSEAPPGEPARRWRFLDRNRLIAALTRGAVVVEAARRSGALATARRSADLGRVVMGVPGPVTTGVSAGVHALLRSGEARLVTSGIEAARDLEEHDTEGSSPAGA